MKELPAQVIVAATITMAVLAGLNAFVDNDQVTETHDEWFRIAAASVIVWFIVGPVWTMSFFQRRRVRPGDHDSSRHSRVAGHVHDRPHMLRHR
jgi:hypothetical protein